jgi:hypothetical protein
MEGEVEGRPLSMDDGVPTGENTGNTVPVRDFPFSYGRGSRVPFIAVSRAPGATAPPPSPAQSEDPQTDGLIDLPRRLARAGEGA